MTKTKKIHRSSITGKTVTPEFAEENKATTQTETVKIAPKKALEVLEGNRNYIMTRSPYHSTNVVKQAIDEILEYFK